MSLEIKITAALKQAMKDKDKVALESLRAIKSQLLLLKTESKDAEVTESQEMALLQRLIKQRKESAEQFQNNNREELATLELAQSKVIEQFLPEQISIEKLTESIKEIVAETGASSIKDMGKVMGIASAKFAGKAEGKTISTIVKDLLK